MPVKSVFISVVQRCYLDYEQVKVHFSMPECEKVFLQQSGISKFFGEEGSFLAFQSREAGKGGIELGEGVRGNGKGKG